MPGHSLLRVRTYSSRVDINRHGSVHVFTDDDGLHNRVALVYWTRVTAHAEEIARDRGVRATGPVQINLVEVLEGPAL